jgi:hypothetical protein
MCQTCGCPAVGNEQIKICVEGINGLKQVEQIERALLRLPGVYHVQICAQDGMTTVDYNPGRTPVADMEKALTVAGFKMSV